MSFLYLRRLFSGSSSGSHQSESGDVIDNSAAVTASSSRATSAETDNIINGENRHVDMSDASGEGGEEDFMDVFDDAESGTDPPSPGPSRGHGKSPMSSDSSNMSPGQTKKMKISEEQDKTETDHDQSEAMMEEFEDNQDECFDDSESEMDSDENYELSSGDSEDFLSDTIFDRDTKVSSTSSEEDSYPFEVLSIEDIGKRMEENINEAKNVLGLPFTTTRLLLSQFRWDNVKLVEAYFAGGDSDRDQLFQKVCVANPFTAVVSSSTNGVKEECQICFDEVLISKMFGMKCGHRYCTTCWERYLVTQIVDEGHGLTISCIHPNCKLLVEDATVVITDSNVKLKYQRQITKGFVICNRYMKWCPGPDCTYAVKVQHLDDHGKSVTCRCGHSFCFECAADAHDPVWCDMLKKWLKKNADDSETCNWIAVNTKECPKCKAAIQKNGGCNHMQCRNTACNEEFCWICLGPWRNHDAYRCNHYNDNDGTEARQQQEKSRESLHRYLFYFNRYYNHQNSLKLEHKLHELVKDKMADMSRTLNMSWVEVQFLKNAVDTLCRCRQTLMSTYVFAFYVAKTEQNNQIEIFEANQEDLQTATEKLSGFLENDVATSDIMDLKQKVHDMFRYCETRRQVLLDHVREGHAKDWWKFIY